jgi:hypothetical protein
MVQEGVTIISRGRNRSTVGGWPHWGIRDVLGSELCEFLPFATCLRPETQMRRLYQPCPVGGLPLSSTYLRTLSF